MPQEGPLVLYASTYGDRRGGASNNSSSSVWWWWSLVTVSGTVGGLWWWQQRQRQKRRARDDLASGEDNDLLLQETFARNSSGSSSTKHKCIYLDYNGTSPVHPDVLQAMLPYFTTHFGNPSAGHVYGREPKKAIDRARQDVLMLLGRPQADPTSIWFTGSGTESDHMAIQCALQAYQPLWDQRQSTHNNNSHTSSSNEEDYVTDITATELPPPLPHIVTSNVEHPAVEAYLKHLASQGKCTVTFVPVQTDGRVTAEAIIAACQANIRTTILVTLMYANNETGALQPVAEVAHYCRAQGILCHTDAAQAAGKVNLDLNTALGDVDMVTIVGHKMGAPKGVACLYVRPGCLTDTSLDRALPDSQAILFHGGGQEFGRRAGTPNVPYIVGLGHAAREAAQRWPQRAKHMAAVTEYLWEQLQDRLVESDHQDDPSPQQRPAISLKRHGPSAPHERLPNTLSVGLAGVPASHLLAAVADQVAASAGASCHASGGDRISSVLQAMQIPTSYARGTIRLSVGPSTTFADVERAAAILAQHAISFRAWQ